MKGLGYVFKDLYRFDIGAKQVWTGQVRLGYDLDWFQIGLICVWIGFEWFVKVCIGLDKFGISV